MRSIESVRIALGVTALTKPPDQVFGRPCSTTEAAVLRLLGVRQVVQGLVVAATGWHALGAAVDLLHGSSMVLLALARPSRYGHAAWRQAATAAGLVALELAADRRG